VEGRPRAWWVRGPTSVTKGGLYSDVRGTLTATALTSGSHLRDVPVLRLTA